MAARRRWFWLLLLIATMAVGGRFIYVHCDSVIRDCYAEWWVADMVIEHLRRNEGRWPRSWDDLVEPYEICVSRSGQPWTFDELRNRVEVDFTADPAQLVLASPQGKRPFRVIFLRNGGEHHWSGHEPNRMVWDYLKNPAPRNLRSEISNLK